MSHIAITIQVNDTLTDLLIAQLSEIGFEGFEEQEQKLIAYIPADDLQEEALNDILAPHGITYTKEIIQPVNWNAVWESNFQPVLVDDFCGIRAEFHDAFNPKPDYEIVITPKMAFGTGHHATTSSMIRLMETLPVKGKRVFDFGTGTGILAILAEMMGASVIDAIDYDEWAVNNTRENIEANGMTKTKVWQADTLTDISSTYDIILANINCNILLQFMGEMKRILAENGQLLLSGILTTDEPQITEAAAAVGLQLTHKIEKDNWLALQFETK
ncbi:50S ribosomal protein L11 methyltransferase [Chitinophaga silvatica]|uniref:Ribosomal protein L11 methyltransferase n=1 Tax=Chitinophaga silvatica TaxID=2282649 RepID=A0A3E1Y4X4_9BACT|nr:50S ribosomal protein L11 methyltransferase [Chitinophaga silvatica]RFS19760.1 50S ribosomal protein L11 methyltransferase [Chitinophaga silvatica]